MQKKTRSDKANTRRDSRISQTRRPQSRNSADSVKDLLRRSTPVLAGLQREARRQRDWLQWVQRELPAELAGHVTGVREQSGELVIFAESAAWGGRLRYAAPQLLGRVDPQAGIVGVKVRVVPRAGR
ncbi:MAG TPA: DciA family protein [Steroidobacteraceae bacterium]|nr:DciA family protein [Steroidobacteraceae bacterium]